MVDFTDEELRLLFEVEAERARGRGGRGAGAVRWPTGSALQAAVVRALRQLNDHFEAAELSAAHVVRKKRCSVGGRAPGPAVLGPGVLGPVRPQP